MVYFAVPEGKISEIHKISEQEVQNCNRKF